MQSKRIIMLTGAVLAMMAIAIPAIAAAGTPVWIDNETGEPLAGNGEITYEGTLEFDSAFGGAHCESATGTGVVEPGHTGTITSFETAECSGYGLLAACTVVHSEAQELPWTTHATVTGPDVEVTAAKVETEFTGGFFCPLDTLVLEGDFTAIPDDPEAISGGTIEGELESSLGPVEVHGNLTGTPAGRYGIGTE